MKIKKIIVCILLLLGVILPVKSFLSINDQIEPQVESIAMVEAKNASTKVVQKTIDALKLDTTDLMRIVKDEENVLVTIQYNTEKLNQILTLGIDAATESLSAASLGLIDPYTHILYYDKGIIYSVHWGYFTGIALFSELGPKLNVRLKVMHTSSGEIRVKTTPYGLNNTLVEIDLVLVTDMVVITPFLMRTVPMECRIPLVIQLVQGFIPTMEIQKNI